MLITFMVFHYSIALDHGFEAQAGQEADRLSGNHELKVYEKRALSASAAIFEK